MIRRIFIFVLAGLSVVSPAFADDNEFVLNVIVTGADRHTGQVLVSLFGSPESYLNTPTLETTAEVDGEGEAFAALGKQAPGVYAIVVVYDKNKNGKLDTRIFRIPKEKIGYSNNAKGKLGPAKWDDALFTMTDSALTIEFQLASVKRE